MDFSEKREKQSASLADQNANLATLQEKHPFLEGCKNPPTDRDGEIQEMRQWLKQQPHLPPLTDEHLILFLHSNYYNIAETQSAIEAYYAVRTSSPELFANKSLFSNSVASILNVGNLVSMPDTTPEDYKLLLYRLIDYDASKVQFNDALKAFFLFNDIRLSEDGLSPGYIVVFDMKGISLSHLAKINLSSIRKFMTYIQEGHPARLKGVHVINSVSFMDRVLALVRPLMKSSLIKLLTIHGSDLTNLFNIIPQELFPQEYGGKAGSMQKLHDNHRKMMESRYARWAEEEELFVIDVTKRPKPAKKSCFIANSFKSLAID